MLANAGRSDRNRYIDPLAAELDGFGARRSVGRIKLSAGQPQVNDVRAGFRDRLSKRIEIRGLGGMKMVAERIYVVYAEFFDDQRRKLL